MAATVYPSNATYEIQPTSGAIRRERGRETRTVVLRGLRSSLEPLASSTYAPGTIITGSSSGPVKSGRWVVASVDVVPNGDSATLRAVLQRTRGSGTGSDSVLVKWDCEMVQLEKDILSHPTFAEYADVVQAWKAETNPDLKRQYKYTASDGTATALTGDALLAAQKISKGQESCLLSYPVIRKTTTATDGFEDIGEDCNKIDEPTGYEGVFTLSGDWVFLKTRDTVQSSDDQRVVRVEEWTGADEWDEDLYEEA